MADAPKQNHNTTAEEVDVSCPENVNYFSSGEMIGRETGHPLLQVNSREVFEQIV